MSKITLDNLSDNLKAYLEGLGLSEEQVLNLINENGLDEEELKEMLKDTMSINELNTNSKTVIGAINELFQSANNGKQLIASAIGEPLDSNDTFSAMSDDINGLLATFKTNMMNNGVTVESNDRFKSLIDKIATLADNEGKGMRIIEGQVNYYSGSGLTCIDSSTSDGYNQITLPLTSSNFTPVVAIACHNSYEGRVQYLSIYSSYLDNVHAVFYNGTVCHHARFKKSGVVKSNSVVLPVLSNSSITSNPFSYTVIGIGEEDTTLRDSLASILQEEGVSVTNEDDMASLISKVDQEFDRQVVPAGDATVNDVIAGKTFMNSSGELLTGNIVNQPAITNAISVGKWKTDIYFRIPQGVYLTNSYDGYPEILCKATDIDSNIKPENIISGKSICGINGTANINSLGGFHRAYGDGLYNVNTYLNTLSINTNLNVTYIKNGFIIFDYLYVNSNLVRNVSLSVNLDTTINNITIRPSYNNGIISFTVSDTNVFANGVYSWCIYY
jgi:hypothetical protein